ncbi:MAG: hypothetical protein ABIG44_18965 [Planctomycetota bacterium]
MRLRFPESEIKRVAQRYEVPEAEIKLIELKAEVQRCGYVTKDQLRRVAHWKAARSARHVEKNDDDYVREITSWALKARSERARIEILTVLDGVGWPTASAILHLFHERRYPILDFRALWSVGLEVPNQYSFLFWQPYVEFCREVARRHHVNMRTLDRALWQYSKENQGG